MATSSADDLKTVTSPLDLSQKIVHNDNAKSFEDHKSVSSEELLSLKLLHDRLTKTMERLLPQEKLKKCEVMNNSQTPSLSEFDYKTTIRALLSLVETENVSANEDDDKSSNFFPNKVPVPSVDTWAYWHDYVLSLYLMNPSVLPPLPSIPPPTIPHTSLNSSMFLPPYSLLSPSPNSVMFQTMLNNIISRSSTKSQEEPSSKNVLIHENLNPDYGLKNKKLNSFQFLKDSSLLYNSFATSRNIGLAKTKLLDSPESFGVSLRGNQKYSIYYQQRPNNIFNNNFISPTNSSTMNTKYNNNSSSSYKNLSMNNNTISDCHTRKSHISMDINHKKSLHTNTNRMQKSINKLEPLSANSKNSLDNVNRLSNVDHGHYNGLDHLPVDIRARSRQRETVFNCSCGQEFENLYSFTIHMKSTHHSPNSSKIERSIPKLVRGQDMWINSETEQTKEILRCMRCQQSFRTLPELTMHMVETNHYSEIVYSDTGKCVFLNTDSEKLKQSYTTISSPLSSPGDNLRKQKRPLSSSTGSDIGVDDERIKKMKISRQLESVKEVPLKELAPDSESLNHGKDYEILQIKEADSGTADTQPDSESQVNSRSLKVFEDKECAVNSTNSCDSVIRQIENFVEKNLPKPLLNEFSMAPSIQKSSRTTIKSGATKSNNIDKVWKTDSKTQIHDKSVSLPKHKEKTIDFDNFSYKNYSVSSSDNNVENPLSSLQSLVETIQRNTTQIKDQSISHYKGCSLQSKESSSYSYPSKSPVVSDSLSQLQALVAGTSVNPGATLSRQNETKHLGYSLNERNNDVIESSSSAFLSWCHRLGELLGLPQALSQAMLTQDAIKELANSVLMLNSVSKSSPEENQHSDENKFNVASAIETFQNQDSDPMEQLKNLLKSASDPGLANNSQILTNKFLNSSNQTPNSPPSLTKKAKCHYCNKPFANKGQVRLHISKGKCPSLMRSSHSSCTQPDQVTIRNTSPNNYDLNYSPIYRLKDDKSESDSNYVRDSSTHNNNNNNNNKSINLIREYLKFAKHMIGNDDSKLSVPTKFENTMD